MRSGPPAGIENWLPRYDIGQRHEVVLSASAEQAVAAALSTPAAPDRLVRALFRLRGLDPHGSIRAFMAANGFTVLEETATTFVVGLVACRRNIPVADAAAWRQASLPGSIRIAADFRAEPRGSGTRLITETRVAAMDRRALWGFRLYWLLVGPFSKLIRRRWLRAAAEGARIRQAG